MTSDPPLTRPRRLKRPVSEPNRVMAAQLLCRRGFLPKDPSMLSGEARCEQPAEPQPACPGRCSAVSTSIAKSFS